MLSFYQWIDLVWIPVSLVAVHRGQRLKTICFVLACIMTLRTQLELMDTVGHPDGFLGLIGLGLYERGLIIYGFFIGLLLILSYYSPGTRGSIFLAACITLYFGGFFISTLALLL